MIELRTHYFTNGGPRCGQPLYKNFTVDPACVTCGSCKRLMKGKVK